MEQGIEQVGNATQQVLKVLSRNETSIKGITDALNDTGLLKDLKDAAKVSADEPSKIRQSGIWEVVPFSQILHARWVGDLVDNEAFSIQLRQFFPRQFQYAYAYISGFSTINTMSQVLHGQLGLGWPLFRWLTQRASAAKFAAPIQSRTWVDVLRAAEERVHNHNSLWVVMVCIQLIMSWCQDFDAKDTCKEIYVWPRHVTFFHLQQLQGSPGCLPPRHVTGYLFSGEVW